jgi:hypothetical protein
MNADTRALASFEHLTLADLIRYARPASQAYANGDDGSAGHLTDELFKRSETGICAFNGGNRPSWRCSAVGRFQFR